jgi:DNA mismatch repair protein MutH
MASTKDQIGDTWNSPRLIVEHANKLSGRSIRDVMSALDATSVSIGTKSKAAFGTFLENVYFGINPGNSPLPDFPVAQLELKSTPLKWIRENLVAKERLVLNKIDYVSEATTTFTTSSFFKKCRRLLIVAYIHDAEKSIEDLEVARIRLVVLDLLPEEDRRIIIEDWAVIHDKISNGKAHEISEGDTRLLAACTKSALGIDRTEQRNGPPAKPRAYSFKQSYVNILLATGLSSIVREEAPIPYGSGPGYQLPDKAEDWPNSFLPTGKTITFEEEITNLFENYANRSVQGLYEQFGVNGSAKHANYNLVISILGRKSRASELLDAAGIQIKTVQLKSNGVPKESMSFPVFSFSTILKEDWDDVDVDENHFRNHISKRFLFVIFQCTSDCAIGDHKVFKGVKFWNMPFDDLEVIKERWEQTKEAVSNSNPNLFPKIRDRQIMHVRPKGRDGDDTDEFPNGLRVTKRCFWLNADYIGKILHD